MYKLLKINLAAFEGGGEGSAAPAAAQGSNPAPAQPGMGSNTAAPAQPQEGQQSDAPQKPSFDELIKGEYKQEYDKRVRELVGRRLSAAKTELDAVRPIMALLQQRYDISDGDGMYAAVQRALESDNDYWQTAADKAGMTAEQYRTLMSAQARNRDLQARLDAQLTEQRKNEATRYLLEEAERVRAQYPEFDLETELSMTPKLGALLRNGIDMLTAYQVCHQADMLQAAQKAGEVRTANAVRSNQARPAENGTGGGQAAKLAADPSKWTKGQLRDVQKRVMRGERIVLG